MVIDSLVIIIATTSTKATAFLKVMIIIFNPIIAVEIKTRVTIVSQNE